MPTSAGRSFGPTGTFVRPMCGGSGYYRLLNATNEVNVDNELIVGHKVGGGPRPPPRPRRPYPRRGMSTPRAMPGVGQAAPANEWSTQCEHVLGLKYRAYPQDGDSAQGVHTLPGMGRWRMRAEIPWPPQPRGSIGGIHTLQWEGGECVPRYQRRSSTSYFQGRLTFPMHAP